MHYFRIETDVSGRYTGYIDGSYKWGLPGVICPVCQATWSDGSKSYPSIDLTSIAALADFETPRAEPIEEYERLCTLVRPLLPPEALLEPGTTFGPFVGKYQGRFGQLVAPDPWWLLAQHEALDALHAAGLRHLTGCQALLKTRQRDMPELFELELIPQGRLHPDSLPAKRAPPCPRCGRTGLSLPDELLLDAKTLPAHLDLFRLEDFSSVIVCTERFFATCQRLGLDGVVFQPLPTRTSAP
ncbi:double-CXXCG motif protein [Cystobacter fuscus]|uniref:SitI6 family double-CXXCG motif immunity protein n=1 Tax=Cystobacter fuscus TaxID=43 RepID=UPI002B315B2B|nr:hypothetical protein F0U63_09840 [Cystobacter fuscus]